MLAIFFFGVRQSFPLRDGTSKGATCDPEDAGSAVQTLMHLLENRIKRKKARPRISRIP